MDSQSPEKPSVDRVGAVTTVIGVIALALLVGYMLFWIQYLFLNRWPTQEQAVPSGYRLILEARQIDDLFGPAWHQIANYEEPDVAEWQTTALFDGRYELLMTVDVRLNRRTGRIIEVLGEPQFSLMEVTKVEARSISYGDVANGDFDIEKWHQVVRARGDFSVIGVQLKQNAPVPGFDRYKAEARNGLQFSTPSSCRPQ